MKNKLKTKSIKQFTTHPPSMYDSSHDNSSWPGRSFLKSNNNNSNQKVPKKRKKERKKEKREVFCVVCGWQHVRTSLESLGGGEII